MKCLFDFDLLHKPRLKEPVSTPAVLTINNDFNITLDVVDV